MRSVRTKNETARQKMAADRSFVWGFSCPYCGSKSVLLRHKDAGALHNDKTEIACWDCMRCFTVAQSKAYMEKAATLGKSALLTPQTEEEMSAEKASGECEDGGAQAPALHVPRNRVGRNNAEKTKKVPQSNKVKDSKKNPA